MKNSSLKTLVLLLILSQPAWSEECADAKISEQVDAYFYDKETVKQALMVLLQSRALTFQPAKGVRIRKDLIEELRSEGVIESVPKKEAVICVDTK